MRFSSIAFPAASAFIALPLFSTSLLAQTGSHASDAVVVTATRTPTRVSELTSDITVIERDQLERAGTLMQALRMEPGIEVTQQGGPGTVSSIFLRGTNSDHILVLVDGVRLGSASLGTTAFEHIPVDQIERIEVLRGTASSLYGSAALGGVIQIFTRSGAGSPGVNASASYGSYGTTTLSAGTGYEKDGLRVSVQAGSINTSGINAIANPGNTSFNLDTDPYRNLNVTAKIAKRLGTDGEVGFNTFYSDGVARFDSIPNTFDHRNHVELSSHTAYLRTRVTDLWRTQFTAGASTDDSTSISSTTPSITRTVQNQWSWQNDIALPVGSLMMAIENVEQRLTATTAYPVTRRSIDSLVAGYQAGIGAHRIQLSSRQDRYDQLGNHNSGSVGYGYELTPELRFTASSGTAFKAPSFNQLYFPNFGNPNLAPESASNSEFGLRYEPKNWKLSVVRFENRIKDLIVNAGSPLRPVNVGQARIKGTTFSASTEIAGTWLSGNLNIQDPKDATNGLLLPRRAKHFGTISATRPALGGNLGVEVYAAGARYSDTANLQRLGGYTLFGAFYETPLGRGLTGFARADNLADKRYQMVQDFNVPGRTVFVGVRYAPGP